MSTKNLLNNKVIIVAILAVGAVAGILVALPIAQATAQQQVRKMMLSGESIPEINGSVNITNETNNFINENIKVTFVAAAETAQGRAADGKLIAGHLGVVQGYLVYTFFVADNTNRTGYLTVIDAGNGEVLYTSEGQLLSSFDNYSGHWGNDGYGAGWHGPWKGHSWGFWG